MTSSGKRVRKRIKDGLKRIFHLRRPKQAPGVGSASPTCLNGATFDVLVPTFSFLRRRQDVLSLMLTCHALYIAGISTLLSDMVTLRSCSSVASFCAFMFRDLETRAYALKKLRVTNAACRVSHGTPSSSMSFPLSSNGRREDHHEVVLASMPIFFAQFPTTYVGPHACLTRFLFKILLHAQRLEFLEVKFIEDWLRANPQLLFVSSGLKRLKTLNIEVQSSADRTTEFVKGLADSSAGSSLVNVSLGFGGISDPTELLEGLPDTVEQLVLNDGRLNARMSKTFPAIKSLTLSGRQLLDVRVLVQAFPNLVELHCEDAFPDYSADTPNLRDQNHRTLSDQNTYWKELELLDGNTNVLYMLGCPGGRHVPKLVINGYYDTDTRYFASLVNEAKPHCLSYTTTAEFLTMDADLTGLATEAANGVVELHVQLWEPDSFPHEPNNSLIGLFAFLALFHSLNRLFLFTSFTTNLSQELPGANSFLPRPDFEVQLLASKCPPSLRYMAFQTSGSRLSHWRIGSRGGGGGLPKVKRMKRTEVEGVSWQLPIPHMHV